MIVTRTPLRVSFVGGGSDLPAFFAEEEGMVVSAAIDRYVHVTVSRKFDPSVRVAYSTTENVPNVADLQHSRVRAALRRYGPATHVEIHSIADIPAGTGLGSSSSFTVGLLHALHAHAGAHASAEDLAAGAVQLELEDCAEPIGVQDQYIAAYGGLCAMTFRPGRTQVERLDRNREIVDDFNRHALLLWTGLPPRDAGAILREQARMDTRTRAYTGALVRLAREFRVALLDGSLETCGRIMAAGWVTKQQLSAGIANEAINAAYTQALRAGAWGGKLCGAGGSGFLLFLAPPDAHGAIAKATGMRAVPIRLGVQGSAVVYG